MHLLACLVCASICWCPGCVRVVRACAHVTHCDCIRSKCKDLYGIPSWPPCDSVDMAAHRMLPQLLHCHQEDAGPPACLPLLPCRASSPCAVM
jgi:hypothetical protein